MLIAKLRVLLPDRLDALLHDGVFFFAAHLFFLHEKSIVGDAQLFDQVRHFLLLAPIKNGLLTTLICFRLVFALKSSLA